MPDYFMYEVLPYYVLWAVGTMCTTIYFSRKETR